MDHKGWADYYNRIIIQNKCKIKDDCAICLESCLNKSIAYLPCKHYFHATCFNKNIETKNYSCPLCRYDLTNSLKQIGHKFVQDDDDDDDEHDRNIFTNIFGSMYDTILIHYIDDSTVIIYYTS